MSECQTKAGNQECFESVKLSDCQVVKLSSSCQVVKFDPSDMLNNFCFHIYAQKSLFIGENGKDFFGHQHHPLNFRNRFGIL